MSNQIVTKEVGGEWVEHVIVRQHRITLNYRRECIMAKYENRYVIKQLEKSTDEGYQEALTIYNEETPPGIYTNSNEITSWLDHPEKNTSFEMIIYALYLDNKVIGFSQITYLPSTKVAILDYITLGKSYRANAAFLVFLSLIRYHLSLSGKSILYYIAEISNKDGGTNIDRESEFYKRIVCLENFGFVNSKYYNIPLGLTNHEGAFESLMYIKANDNIKFINKETFIDIVSSICYDYYLTWYTKFLSDKELKNYKEKLDSCYNNIKKSAGNEVQLEIVYPACPLFYSQSNDKTYGSLPAKKKKSIPKIPVLILLVLVIPIVLVLIYSKVLNLLDIPFGTISTFIGSAISTITSVLIVMLFNNKK